jgi:hypothetical protein
MSLEDVGNLKPSGGSATVREIVGMLNWATAKIGAIEAPKGTSEWYAAFNGIVNALPMVGETMFRGDKCLLYCGPAKDYCFALAGKRGLL